MGRPKPAAPKARLHIYVDPQVQVELLALAKRFRISASAVVSQAVSKMYRAETGGELHSKG